MDITVLSRCGTVECCHRLLLSSHRQDLFPFILGQLFGHSSSHLACTPMCSCTAAFVLL